MNALRTLARRVGIGRAIRVLYYDPVERARNTIKAGGPFEMRRTEAAHREMTSAAHDLPPIHPRAGASDAEFHILTGTRFWDQTLFFAASVQLASPDVRVVPILYDDGTLTDADVAAVRRVLPATRAERYADIEARLDASLPADRFPALRARRLVYPHLRKLTDVHAGQAGWKLVADSDMLVFREPTATLSWLAAPDRPLHMVDAEPAYGYSEALMVELAGAPIPPLVNVGLFGFRSEAIDWEALEHWVATLEAREGTHYFLEQALSAMLTAGYACTALPRSEYRVLPDLTEGRAPTAVLHHYVAESKRSYFQDAWRIVNAALVPSSLV